MPKFSPTALMMSLSLTCGGALGTQVAAQTLMTPAQCDQVLMTGPQSAAPAVLAACSSYFSTLAEGALAPGTFATVRPGTQVVVSTSGTGD
jgi:molecular chaperone DnaK (HSP70)